jgi:hypothetical protein
MMIACAEWLNANVFAIAPLVGVCGFMAGAIFGAWTKC